MIQHIDIAASQKSFTIDSDLEKYIKRKIGKLDRHMKRRNRDAARADVKLKENKTKDDKKYTCEVILHIPGTRLTAIESTMNMFAAVDIVEAKLQNQLKKHKEKTNPDNNRRKNSRAKRRFSKLFRKG